MGPVWGQNTLILLLPGPGGGLPVSLTAYLYGRLWRGQRLLDSGPAQLVSAGQAEAGKAAHSCVCPQAMARAPPLFPDPGSAGQCRLLLGSPAHVPRGRTLCCPGSQARPSETPSPPAVPRPCVLHPGAWLPPWLLPGEEEELELTVVSCALEFNISSSSRAARICRRQAAPVFITTLPGRPSPTSRRWEPGPGPQRGRVRTPRPLPARSTDWARRPVGGKDRTCLGVDSWGLLRGQGGRRPCGQS